MLSSKKLPSFVQKFMITVTVIATVAAFLLFPTRYKTCVSDALSLWAVSVLPATFPALFLTAYLSQTPLFAKFAKTVSPAVKAVFGVSGEGGCIAVMSALSGYPVGAKLLSSYVQSSAVSKQERFRLACLCTTSGPTFLIGVVGSGMFASPVRGWILLLSHFVGVYAVCFFLRLQKSQPTQTIPLPQSDRDGFAQCLNQAISSSLSVGGYIALFCLFGQVLCDLRLFELLAYALPFLPRSLAQNFLRGLMEMTVGCALLAKEPSALSLSLACFLVTFGGICVLMQQLFFLRKTGVSTAKWLSVKAVQALLSACLCYVFCLLFGV